MIKLKTKFMSVLMALCCFCASLGVISFVFDASSISASAKTEYVITSPLVATGDSSATAIYAYPQIESQKPAFKDGAWSYNFTFVAGTGKGKLFNGEQIGGDLKKPGEDFYINFGGKTAVEGDIIVLDGEFYNSDVDTSFIFEDASLKYNGSAWVAYYQPIDAGEVVRVEGDASGVYLVFADGVTLPVSSWDDAFNEITGTGITIDGTMVSTDNNIKSVGNKLFVALSNVQEGSVLEIAGTFRSAKRNYEYVINESKFEWNGTAWVEYVPPIEYTVHEIGALTLHVNSKSYGGAGKAHDQIYLERVDGEALPVLTWDHMFLAENAENFKINGENASLAEMKSTGAGLFFKFKELAAGEYLTISGTFYCETLSVKYVIEESSFIWTGSEWQSYVVIDYDVYEIGKVKIGANSGASAVYFDKLSGEAFEVTEGTWTEKLSFEVGSGAGVTINGNQISMNDIKIPNNIYVGLGTTAQEGDLLVIEGTFYNATLAVKYVVEESKFVWNGTAWEVYVPDYNAVELGRVALYTSQTSTATTFYFTKSQNSFTSNARNKVFSHVLGTGILLNGEVVEGATFKQNSTTYFTLSLSGVETGAILTIGGTFATTSGTLYAYEFEDSQFQWNGSAWVEYVPPVVEIPTYEVGAVVATGDSNSAQVYFAKANGTDFEVKGDWEIKLAFVEGSGVGITLNGTQIAMNDIKIPGSIFVGLGRNASTGDKLVIEGTFYSEDLNVKYIIEESTFYWTGAAWIELLYAESELVAYDVVSLSDIGLGVSIDVAGGSILDYTSSFYNYSANNVTGSVKFRFGYNSTDANSGSIDIRLRGTHAWDGVQFNMSWSTINYGGGSFKFANNTDYVIEVGAIDLLDGSGTWVYVAVNEIVVISKNVDLSETGYNTNRISVYINDGVAPTTLTDCDNVSITYNSNSGTFVEYAEKASVYALADYRTLTTAIGWAIGGKLYQAGQEITVESNIVVNAVEIDFVMDDGAAIRLSSMGSVAGIRFTSMVKESDLNALLGNYGIREVSYGTIIMPFDYLTVGQAPNLEDTFKNILNLPSTYSEVENGYVVFRGAMTDIRENNYDRFFAGRGYIQITFENDDVWTIYTPFSYENNVRSIRYVAQHYIQDAKADVNYSDLDAETKAVVDTYAAVGRIHLIDYTEYVENSFNVTAWYHPELDPSNGYNNVTNEEIAQALKDAGISTVILDGEYYIDLREKANVEKTRKVIEFFWSQGLKTVAFGADSTEFVDNGYPDFSDCKGFVGFLVFDEPTPQELDTLATLANAFEEVYAGTNVTYMANLFPSYYSEFQLSGGSWYNKEVSINKAAYKGYLQDYCDKVLAKVSGEKFLSMDSYPIFADYSLHATFLFDLAMLKYYSIKADATSHAVLQSSGWEEGGQSAKNRMPTEAELRMQAYTAMAFGIDSISWWSYSDMRGDNQNNPTDNSDYYTRFANINNELNSVGAVYSAFNWRGVILGAGANNGGWNNSDQDYNAFKNVQGQIGDYELATSDTKYLASVATNKTDWNYLMGVMEDVAGNEAYVLCNYNDHSTNRAQTITIKFNANTNVTSVVIYRGGAAQTVSVTNKTLTVNLATGEGLIIIPSQIG